MNYNNNEKAIIFYCSFDLSYKKQIALFSLSENYGDLIENFNEFEFEIKKIINDDDVFNKICEKLSSNFIDTYINNLNNKHIVCVTVCSENYPNSLLNIDQPPYILFCIGDVSLLNTETIAIVGTRTPTSYGKMITEQFAKGLCENGFTIVSGLAVGVDTVAHKTALENNGKTIAVLGSGFNHIYPAYNFELSTKIANLGLLVSEYSLEVKPALYTFPFRNRIIAGLAKGVLITEAGEKSGALHTKEYALENGIDVFAVPGNVNSAMSKGTNRLIKTLQGSCVLSYEDIVNVYHEKVVTNKDIAKRQITLEDKLILDALKIERKSIDELAEITKLSISKLNSCLTMFEIQGVITRLPGNFIELVWKGELWN